MNVERNGWLLPARGDRWLPSLVAEAFMLERLVPSELDRILRRLEVRGPRFDCAFNARNGNDRAERAHP